jgi:hypothetical protein
MVRTRAITVRLDPTDYDRLSAEAQRLGMRPGTLVRVYLRAGLARNDETEAERRRRIGLEALDRLAALTADLPLIDAVRIAEESRHETRGTALSLMAVVVDASLLVVLVSADPRPPAVEGRMRAWLEVGEELHAPELLPYEVASGLTRLVAGGVFAAGGWRKPGGR